MDLAETINELTQHMADTSWHIYGLVAFPDLKGFQQQETDMKSMPVEFVRQSGDADYGFVGEIYFPTSYPNGDGGVMHLHIGFCA